MDELVDLSILYGEENIGANVLVGDLLFIGIPVEVFEELKKVSISGVRLYTFYKDCCSNNVDNFLFHFHCIKSGLITKEEIDVNLDLVRPYKFFDIDMDFDEITYEEILKSKESFNNAIKPYLEVRKNAVNNIVLFDDNEIVFSNLDNEVSFIGGCLIDGESKYDFVKRKCLEIGYEVDLSSLKIIKVTEGFAYVLCNGDYIGETIYKQGMNIDSDELYCLLNNYYLKAEDRLVLKKVELLKNKANK